jgi:hypothetical protein
MPNDLSRYTRASYRKWALLLALLIGLSAGIGWVLARTVSLFP